ncbi:hypothetical protein ACJ2A9_01025 [Anaerobacillus sp. MEB173]|uniref:hypothetical protein n=1 Tax=Anaerobacillus sp. MEB173 TaxID=3383345 RepID=UPI003F935E02
MQNFIRTIWFTLLTGFVIPWLSTIPLFKRKKEIIIVMAPIAALLAIFVDAFGSYLKLWGHTPKFKLPNISMLPQDFGIFPVLSAWMIYFIDIKGKSSRFVIFLFSLLTIGLESIGLALKTFTYKNGWNMIFAYISYAVAYLLMFMYYTLLRKVNILTRSETL